MQDPENMSRDAACKISQSYLETLEQHLKKNKTLNSVLFNILDKQINPMLFALDLCYQSKIKYPKRGNHCKLLRYILESLKQWCESRDVPQLLTKKQKTEALNKVLLLDSSFANKLVCEIFHLEEIKEHVKHVVSCLLSEKKLYTAYSFIYALDLESEFALESVVFPFFFLGQETNVKAYLSKLPHLQPHFIQILDSLCHNKVALETFIDSLDIESIKPKNLIIDTKWVQKRFPGYIEYFNVDIRNCPNLYRSRVSGAMAFLFRKMYSEESIDYEPFEEMMLDTVKDHLDIQKSLLAKLININESATAFRFAELLKIQPTDWPNTMKNIPYTPFVLPTVARNPFDYLPLRLNRSDIHLVDTEKKLIEAVDDISENYNMVGLDCEWKPGLGIFKEKATLCQLAVWDTVYLLDILALKKYESKQMWEYLLRKIFCNEEVTKLGIGGIYDLTILFETVGCEKESSQHYHKMVDLLLFFKKLRTHYPEVAKEIETTNPSYGDDVKGLSLLCKTVLGRPLDKSEQFSNWERRPLRERQISYAALDAFCLLMIYEKVYPVLKKHELDLFKVLETKQTPFKVEKPKKSKHGANQPKFSKPLSIKDFKAVVDTSVSGVTKYLRLLGADVVALNEGDDHMCAVQIAQSQRRIIITAGAVFKKLSGYVPPDMCFCVDNSLTARQQVFQILEHYKLQCQSSDIFSRCTMCNESNYIHVRDDELLSLWTKFVGFDADMSTIGKKNTTIYQCDVTALDGHMYENVSIQLAAFTPKVFERVRVFLLCAGCGKVYWEGSHLLRLKKTMSQYVDVGNEDKNVYKNLLEELESDDEESAQETTAASHNSA